MYWEQTGIPSGQAVVLLHGGPGAGIDRTSLQLFDTRHYRIITYDQRGAGRSTPAGGLEHNTTEFLTDDLEVLRQHLGIESWIVFGGSWGSTLALVYAQRHPVRTNGLILRGVFLCHSSEIDWYFSGIRHIFPEAWHQFIEFLPKDERENPLDAYYKRILDPAPDIHLPAARQWCLYEARCATLLPNLELTNTMSMQECRVLAKIQAHYFKNGFFVGGTQLLDNIERIRTIPTDIVQGRYDMICPPVSAVRLQQLWPEARLHIVANAGHSISEPGIRRALLASSERFKVISQ